MEGQSPRWEKDLQQRGSTRGGAEVDEAAMDSSLRPIRLQNDSSQRLEGVPLMVKTLLECQAAADACADGQVAGIGGWIIKSSDAAWFADMKSEQLGLS